MVLANARRRAKNIAIRTGGERDIDLAISDLFFSQAIYKTSACETDTGVIRKFFLIAELYANC